MESWAHAVEAGMRSCDERGSEQFFDLQFGDLMEDPIGSVKPIHSPFEQTLPPEGEAKSSAWHESNPQGMHCQNRYA